MRVSRPHNPVMPIDLLVAAGGAAVLIGLGLDWSSGLTGYGSLSLLKLFLLLVGVIALLEPVVLLVTSKTDVPVVWQAALTLLGSAATLILIGKALLPPEGGFDIGFYVVLVGSLAGTAAAWTTVSREK